ncbi:hypothetical protein AVEN_182671-1 [Araneus ventricosus]|uniref:Uncharacterized protein n=1 Tax=Araneus ventricosus TaxID=182803 RepID=A0A4Y2L7D0_ARAVE|nr:hypothetical protein AVEN_182671-1 [Araneus ventricosus]
MEPTKRKRVLLLLFHVPLVQILDQVHDTMSLLQYHKSILPLTPQQPRRCANTLNDKSRRSRTGTRARGISLFFVTNFKLLIWPLRSLANAVCADLVPSDRRDRPGRIPAYKRVLLTVEQKFQIVSRIEASETFTKLSKEFGVGVSTIGDMRRQSCLHQSKLSFKPIQSMYRISLINIYIAFSDLCDIY